LAHHARALPASRRRLSRPRRDQLAGKLIELLITVRADARKAEELRHGRLNRKGWPIWASPSKTGGRDRLDSQQVAAEITSGANGFISSHRILGIDPGLNITGYAVIRSLLLGVPNSARRAWFAAGPKDRSRCGWSRSTTASAKSSQQLQPAMMAIEELYSH
jgi:hypothetical protein